MGAIETFRPCDEDCEGPSLANLLAQIEALVSPEAEREVWGDWEDLNPHEASGGNFDDAYSGGYQTGETNMARAILRLIRPGWLGKINDPV
mgnify:CR=1 FL=1